MRSIGYTGLFALGVVLFAPAFKVAFDFTDMAVYYAPGGLFVLCCTVANVLTPRGMGQRLACGLLMWLLFAASAFSFMVGFAGESALLGTISLNCIFAAFVVAFPWDRRYVDAFTLVCVLAGLVLALNTINIFRTTGDFSGNDARLTVGYLNISFALGVGALCAYYHVVRSLNPLTLAAFAVCWMGLALGNGRGAILFCAATTAGYTLLVLTNRLPSFGRGKKVVLVAAIALFVPIAVGAIMSVERTANRFRSLFQGSQRDTAGGRAEIWADALDKIGDAPIFGHGLGSYFVDGVTPHNVFLQYGEDSGLVGLLIVGLFFLLVLRLLFRSAAISPPTTRNAVYCAAMLFVYMMMNFQKSSDAYLSREIYILSAFPIGLFAYFVTTRGRATRRRRGSELLTQ